MKLCHATDLCFKQIFLVHLKIKLSTYFLIYYLFVFAEKKVSRAFIAKAKTQPKNKLMYISKQNDDHYLKKRASSSLPPQPL